MTPNINRYRWMRFVVPRCVGFAIALLFLLLQANEVYGPELKPFEQNRPEAIRELSKRLVTEKTLRWFSKSMDMKEVADFILSPALLVQECLSEDSVVTYPSE